ILPTLAGLSPACSLVPQEEDRLAPPRVPLREDEVDERGRQSARRGGWPPHGGQSPPALRHALPPSGVRGGSRRGGREACPRSRGVASGQAHRDGLLAGEERTKWLMSERVGWPPTVPACRPTWTTAPRPWLTSSTRWWPSTA